MKKKKPIKSVANRRPDGKFGPHNIANPDGRPKKGTPITDFMRELLHAKPELKAQLVETLMAMALKGDIAAIRK